MSSSPISNKVLIADDDPAVLRLITAIVESEGLVPLAAGDGKVAYRLLRTSPGIAAVIVDIKMPYIKGSDLVKFMRNDRRFEKIPVIVMTGHHDAGRSVDSLASGAVAFLPKPFSNSQLRVILQTLFSRSASG
jgi:DNA-binding response OmpR family regulator